MNIGVMATSWEDPADCVRLAQLAEERGIESIWFGEHSHLPIDTQHTFTETTPEFYRRIPDPYIVLAAIAAATTRIRIGTGIALPAQASPLTVAKQTATLDRLSKGRFEWGVGYGWNQQEMIDQGLDPRYRMATFAESVRAVRRLWEDDVSSFQGEHVRFGECYSYPKPQQRPGPPILLGCRPSPRAFRHLAEFCDGWMPSIVQCLEDIDNSLTDLRQAFEAAGRDPDSMSLTFIDSFGFWKDVELDEYKSRRRVSAATLERLQEVGAQRVIVGIPLFRADTMEMFLDSAAELIETAR